MQASEDQKWILVSKATTQLKEEFAEMKNYKGWIKCDFRDDEIDDEEEDDLSYLMDSTDSRFSGVQYCTAI